MIGGPFVILSSDIISPSTNHIPNSFCFATFMLLRNFYSYLSGVLLFRNRLAVSCFTFHVVMYMLFPVSNLNAISFIIFRSSTDSLLSSIFLQSYFPFICARMLLVHCPRTIEYNFLALLVSAQFSLLYALMSSL